MALSNDEVVSRARSLLDHRFGGRPNPVPPEADRLSDMTAAYAIQSAADAILRTVHGYKPIGYKIAGTNPASRAHLRITAPFHWRLYDKLTTTSPAALGDIPFLRVHEPEIAIQLGRDLDPARAPFSAEQVAAATRVVLPAIEIIGTPFEPWAQAGAANLASDNAAFGYWIIGAPVRDWSGIDLLNGAVTLTVNGEVKGTGKGRNVDGGAFGASAWLANALASRGYGLNAGDYITTGSVTPPIPVAPGQHVVADFGPLGRVELRTSGA